MKRLCAGSLLVALSMAPALSAGAQAGEPAPASSAESPPSTEDRAQRLADQAVAAYQAGRFDETVRLYKEAYSLRAEPTIIYNIARASEKGGKAAVALEYYRRYLLAEGTDPKLRQKAEGRVAALSAAPAVRSEPPPSPQVPAVVRVSRPPQSGPAPLWRRPLFLAGASLGAFGVLALAVGGGLHGAAASDASNVTGNSNNDETQKRATTSQAQHLAQGALAGYVIGGAALATGAALAGLAVLRYRHEGGVHVALVPTLQGAQLGLTGGF